MSNVSILRRSANAPSRRVEVLVERLYADLSKLPTDEQKIAYLTAVAATLGIEVSWQE